MCSPPAPGVLPQPKPQPHPQPPETWSFLVRIMRVGGSLFCTRAGRPGLASHIRDAHASLEPDPSLDIVRAHTTGTGTGRDTAHLRGCWAWGVCTKLLTPAHQCLPSAHTVGTPLLLVGRPGQTRLQEYQPGASVHAEGSAQGRRDAGLSWPRKPGSQAAAPFHTELGVWTNKIGRAHV